MAQHLGSLLSFAQNCQLDAVTPDPRRATTRAGVANDQRELYPTQATPKPLREATKSRRVRHSGVYKDDLNRDVQNLAASVR
jgi:hypothetical protein